MDSKKCVECENELKEHAKICLSCLDELKNEKYNDFAYVMASLNNTLGSMLKDNEDLLKENDSLKKENESLKKEVLSKIIDN